MDDTNARPIPASKLGSLYPEGSIIAHIDDGARAGAAEAALRDAGWQGDEVVVASGEEVTRISSAEQGGRTFIQRIAAAFPSEETEIENEFKDAASHGAFAMMVKAETDERRSAASSILKQHRAYGLRYYGKRTITDL